MLQSLPRTTAGKTHQTSQSGSGRLQSVYVLPVTYSLHLAAVAMLVIVQPSAAHVGRFECAQSQQKQRISVVSIPCALHWACSVCVNNNPGFEEQMTLKSEQHDLFSNLSARRILDMVVSPIPSKLQLVLYLQRNGLSLQIARGCPGSLQHGALTK